MRHGHGQADIARGELEQILPGFVLSKLAVLPPLHLCIQDMYPGISWTHVFTWFITGPRGD